MNILRNFNFSKLKEGLSKTRETLVQKISETITRRAIVDTNTIEELEEILLSSDIGFSTSEKIIEKARALLLKESDRSIENIKQIVKEELTEIIRFPATYKEVFTTSHKPYVILMVGVNGSGKTTTIGKLAYNFKKSGLEVMIGSADTFRAAANDQLDIWAKRAGVSIIECKSNDPSAVAYDTLTAAKNKNIDIVLIDTAGRLHTQKNLMDELSKINKVINNIVTNAPHEILLVIDGTAGQNAIQQVTEFKRIININGIIITKLDGTAKGGIVFQICSDNRIPLKYIGVGERIEDLQNFEPKAFVEAIFD